MGLDYIDLMLIHSPQPWTDFRGGDYAAGNREAWRALEDAYKAGKFVQSVYLIFKNMILKISFLPAR